MTATGGRVVLTAWLVASASASASGWTGRGANCQDPNSADGLTKAVDAALMELQGSNGWFHQMRTSSGYTNAMSVFSCTPSDEHWKYPLEAEAHGALQRVLQSGVLRVAGVQWAAGHAADYKTDPLNPTGFWPLYLDAIALKIGEHYGRTITIERVYYSNSRLVVDAVDEGVEVDMSEPYYYIAGFHNVAPRIETLAYSCVTAGLASKFFTRKGSGITNTEQLYDAIAAGPDGPRRFVGFIAAGNYDAVSSMLPDSTTPTWMTNTSDMVHNVLSGGILAGYVSEGEPPSAESFEIFDTGIISPRVALFHKDHLTCTGDGDDETALTVAVIVVAAVALVLALLLAVIIQRERARKPLFMPLLKEATVENVYAAESAKPQL